MSKWMKILAVPLLIAVSLTFVYLVIDYGNSDDMIERYDAVKPDSTSGFSKTLQFMQTYTRTTGDTSLALKLGIPEEDAETIANPNTGTGPGDTGSTGNNYMDAAKAIASTFKSHDCTYKGSGHVNNDFEYSRGSGYGECNPSTSYTAWSYNGKQHTTSHRDCSCFVSSMLYALGYESAFVHRTSGNYGCFTNIKANIKTCVDLKPGDILRKSGHVAMVVAVESNLVYVADCGDTSNITLTATNGYAYTYNTGSSLPSKWTEVYRP